MLQVHSVETQVELEQQFVRLDGADKPGYSFVSNVIVTQIYFFQNGAHADFLKNELAARRPNGIVADVQRFDLQDFFLLSRNYKRKLLDALISNFVMTEVQSLKNLVAKQAHAQVAHELIVNGAPAETQMLQVVVLIQLLAHFKVQIVVVSVDAVVVENKDFDPGVDFDQVKHLLHTFGREFAI